MRTRNERGSVLVMVAAIMVILVFMVGLGLDTGVTTWSRSLGQGAVDAAALSAVSGLPTSDLKQVHERAAALDNDYVGHSGNPITGKNVSLMVYDEALDKAGSENALRLANNIGEANAVRVALETKNPYGDDNPPSAIRVPSFLTPVLRLFGGNTPNHVDVNVTATAVIKGRPDLPIAIKKNKCNVGNAVLNKQSDKIENICWTTFTEKPAKQPTIEEMLKDKDCGTIPPVAVGTEIVFNNGQVQNLHGTFNAEHGPFNGQQCYLIPVIGADHKCNQSGDIKAFARICVLEADPKDHFIKAKIESCDVPLLGTASQCSTTALVRDRKSGM